MQPHNQLLVGLHLRPQQGLALCIVPFTREVVVVTNSGDCSNRQPNQEPSEEKGQTHFLPPQG